MKTILRYRLLKLMRLYKHEEIPWDIVKDHPRADTMLSEMIIGKCFPVIEIAMDFPDTPHKGKMYQRICDLFAHHQIDPEQFSRDEREHLVLTAAYRLTRRFLARQHIGNMYRYMSSFLPQEYIREVIGEAGRETTEVPIMGTSTPEPAKLPSCPEEYLKEMKDMGIGKYVESYSLYNRTHFYRVLKKAAIKAGGSESPQA